MGGSGEVGGDLLAELAGELVTSRREVLGLGMSYPSRSIQLDQGLG